MVESFLDVVFTRDGTGKATRMDYSLIGFSGNTWFAIWLNDVKTDRIRPWKVCILLSFLF